MNVCMDKKKSQEALHHSATSGQTPVPLCFAVSQLVRLMVRFNFIRYQ